MGRKKQKTGQTTSMGTIQRDLFSILPFELMELILSSTSPKDVLAVARTSRHLCNTLVKPHSVSIWKAARQSCRPGIPDPTPNFTEPSYAAYIFDGGPCEQCGKYTSNLYMSFSLRLRFCSETKCATTWKEKNLFYLEKNEEHIAIMRWLPCSEGGWGLEDGSVHYTFHNRKSFYRRSQVTHAVKEYKKFINFKERERRKKGREMYRELHRLDEMIRKPVMNLSKLLIHWKTERTNFIGFIKVVNSTRISELVERERWSMSDLLDAPTFMAKVSQRKRTHEELTRQDIDIIKPAVEAEITKILEKKTRSAEEQAYSERRELIAADYHRRKAANSMNSISNPSVLPTLDVFREQPVIRSMQNKRDMKPDELTKRLKDQTVKDLIEDNLSAWRDQVTSGFLKKFGMQKYREISSKKLHPLDRLTARFLCSKCVAHTKRDAPPLDFKAACAHQCPHLSQKQKSKAKWSMDQFEVDNKANEVTRNLLALLNISEEDKDSLVAMNTPYIYIMCRSCKGEIFMNFKAMQRHSHRHDDMKVDILTRGQMKLKGMEHQQIHWGLCAELTSMAKSAPRKAELQKYGCRHCPRHGASNQRHLLPDEGDANSTNERPTKRSKKDFKLMSFNGLRCHLLQCHDVLHIADEDIYRLDSDVEEGPKHDVVKNCLLTPKNS